MRAYGFEQSNGSRRFKLHDVPRPVPGARELLVRVRAAGMNRGEFLRPLAANAGAGAPVVQGSECAGEVVALGADVSGVSVGDHVMGRCRGAYAEYGLMASCDVMPVPENLSWTQAAAIPIVYMVACDMLCIQGRLSAGEWLLVAGVTSGVGVACLQIGKAFGARVIGTSGATTKLQALAKLGLDAGICSRGPDFHERVLAATGGQGADLVVNVVGGTVFAECLRAMAVAGRLAQVGHVDRVQTAELDLGALHAKRLTLFGVSSKTLKPAQRQVIVDRVKSDLLPLFASGKLQPLVDRVFPFDEINAAKAYMQANSHTGKIVIAGAE